jgi:hypothetical protein
MILAWASLCGEEAGTSYRGQRILVDISRLLDVVQILLCVLLRILVLPAHCVKVLSSVRPLFRAAQRPW